MFFRGARDAMLVAFSTSSSSATLPVSMSVAEENLGIRPIIASTVLPLGATINMDGTALYVGIVSVFAAQAFGIDLAFSDYVLIAGSTTLVSIGTAAVPGASLFLIAAVTQTIGMSPEQTAIVIGFILPFDRPLDMLRTAVNIGGDLSVSTAVANWENEFDKNIFERPINS
jgi:Na+/H+-dicarboxylate symporter